MKAEEKRPLFSVRNLKDRPRSRSGLDWPKSKAGLTPGQRISLITQDEGLAD